MDAKAGLSRTSGPRPDATVAVWRIGSDVTNTLPVLIETLSLVPDGSKWELLEGLEEMGPQAKRSRSRSLGPIDHPGHTGPAKIVRLEEDHQRINQN